MVVPWPLQSQSQERCQSPTMPPRPLPPGLVTLGADALVAPEASSSLTSSVPDTSWGGDPCSAPPSRSPAPQCYKAWGPGWASQGSPMCPQHCPLPFCTLPVHTPHVTQAGMENKVYLHSHGQGVTDRAGLGVRGPQAASGPQPQVLQSTAEGSSLSLPLGTFQRGTGHSRPEGTKEVPGLGCSIREKGRAFAGSV